MRIFTYLLICLILISCGGSDETSKTNVKIINDRVQQLGPISDPDQNLEYNVEIELLNYKWLEDNGKILLQVSVRVKNIGPSGMSEIVNSFDVMKNGVVGEFRKEYSDTCKWNSHLQLAKDASVDQCVSFTGPFEKTVKLIYAPYKQNSLTEGRYIAFDLQR